MRILICDDDHFIIEQMKDLIHTFFSHKKVACPEITAYTDGESLLADSGEKDIVFLDVEMQGVNGIHAGCELKKQNEKTIIFIVTSYIEYLDDAMRFHVFRYLSKPLDSKRFFRNMDDAVKLYHSFHTKVIIQTKNEVVSVFTNDIFMVEINQRKVIVHTVTGDYISLQSMQHWLNTLPDNCFFQTHRSFIINMEYVSDFSHNMVHLNGGGLSAFLSKRNYTNFKNAYLLYLDSQI